jgi:molybdenum cofactor cytidylyltransferase
VAGDHLAVPERLISGVILAAGISSRMGRPKQLLKLGDRTVLQHVVDAAADAGLDETVIVLGRAAEEVAASLELPSGCRTAVNPEYASGQSSSLRAGLRALDSASVAAVVLLGDQPAIWPEAIRSVVEEYRRTGARVVQASYRERPGHPVLLDRRVWPEAEAPGGDVGARDLLAAHPEWVVQAAVQGEAPPDLDTWEDYLQMGGEAGG